MRLNDGGTYPYGFGWELRASCEHSRRIGHTGAWQGFRTSIQRFPKANLTVIVLANLAEARPEAMSLAIAGLLEPALVPPHRLADPLPGPRPPVPIQELLRRVADGRDSALVTPGLHRFLSDAERHGWEETLAGATRWTPARLRACRGSPDRPPWRRGRLALLCPWGRGRGGSAMTALYTDDWRAADVESYSLLRRADVAPHGGHVFQILWQFETSEERAAAFVGAYGPTGLWVAFFRQASGYLGTDLFHATCPCRSAF